MNEQIAKQLVVRAGMELVESGLIARTWGNVSCRVDDKTFAITPSGRPYETLKPEEVVLCSIADTTYEGDIKPSSEKGIHALVYRMKPDINFVIHTHQPVASVISASEISKMPPEGYALLGEGVPIATYGLPGTKTLKKNVEAVLNNQGNAVILAHHGALCYGKDYEETFLTAKQLEEACSAYIGSSFLKASGELEYSREKLYQYYVSAMIGESIILPDSPIPLYSSRRTTDGFILEADTERTYRFTDNMTPEVRYHCEIYKNREDINFICQDAANGLFALSYTNATLRPLLDDFAQIVGHSAKCVQKASPDSIWKALKGRLGVLVPGSGALCCAATKSDLHAVCLVMEKDALAQIGTQLFGGGKALSSFDCWLMHLVYTKSYAKKAKNSTSSI